MIEPAGRRRQIRSPSFRTVSVTIEGVLFDQVERIARESGISRSAIISQLISAGLESRDRVA